MTNPAVELYDYWLTVLNGSRLTRDREGWMQGVLQFGTTTYMGLAPLPRKFDHGATAERPLIAYGYSHYRSADERFTLSSDGHFKMCRMHGYKVRNALEHNTFLTWIHGPDGYNWTAHDTSTIERRHGYRYHWLLSEWDQPFQYVPEWAMRLTYSGGGNEWMHLEETDGQWHILPTPPKVWSQADDRPNLWAAAERRRHRRYVCAERNWLRSEGKLPCTGPSVTKDEREQRTEANREKAANMILTHFDVTTPARSTPLRREREEGLWPLQHGLR